MQCTKTNFFCGNKTTNSNNTHTHTTIDRPLWGGEGWKAMHGIPQPQGSSNTVEEMFGVGIILRVCTLEPLSEDGPVIKHKLNQYKSHIQWTVRLTHTHTHTHTLVYSTSRSHGWHCDVLFCLHCPHTELTWWSPQGSAVLWHSGQK